MLRRVTFRHFAAHKMRTLSTIGGIALGVVFQGTSGATAFLVSAVAALGLVILWPFWMRLHRVPPP